MVRTSVWKRLKERLRLRSKKQESSKKEDDKTKVADPPQLSSNQSSLSNPEANDSYGIHQKKHKLFVGEEDLAHLAHAISASSTFIKSLGVANGYAITGKKSLPKLHRAVWKCNMKKVKAVTKGIKMSKLNAFDKGHRTALHLACSKAHKEIIFHLCALHANINVQDADGATPMHKLIATKDTACLSMLLSFGGDPNLTDQYGQSPLHLVAKIGDLGASILLLEGDAIVDAVDMNGMTALHVATLYGHRRLAASLIADGFYVDAQDHQGRTPLMIAAGEGRIGLVKLLTKNKADLEISDNNMFTAIDYAVAGKNCECAYLIEKAMESEQQLAETETLCPGPLVEPSQDSCLEMNVSDEEVEEKETEVEEKLKEKVAAASSVTESDYRKQRKESEIEKKREEPHQRTLSLPNLHHYDFCTGLMGVATTIGPRNMFSHKSSLSKLTSPVDTQESQKLFSEATKIKPDGLPLGPLNQYLSLGEHSLVNSAPTVQYLNDTMRDMELSHCVSKRARKQLEAELDDYHDEIVGVKENHKLELEQKSLAQAALDRHPSNNDSEMKQSYERSSEDVCQLLEQTISYGPNYEKIAARYKELYECEQRRADVLSNCLLIAEEEILELKTEIKWEHRRSQQLLSVIQSASAGLSPPLVENTASTPSSDGTQTEPFNFHETGYDMAVLLDLESSLV